MPLSPHRVVSRYLLAGSPVTEDFYRKLLAVAQSEDLPDALTRLQRGRASILDPNFPMTVEGLWDYLTTYEVPRDELHTLMRVPPPKAPKTPKGMSYDEFARDVGKNVVLGVSLGDLNPLHLKALSWALTNLPRDAETLFRSEVKKIKLTPPRGSEDASWEPGGVLRLSLKNSTPDPKVFRFHIVHELGHALEEKLGLTVTPWDDTPYGNPPFVSEYAGRNATEDFAETFRALVMEPAHLKRVAPSKYSDMRRRAVSG